MYQFNLLYFHYYLQWLFLFLLICLIFISNLFNNSLLFLFFITYHFSWLHLIKLIFIYYIFAFINLINYFLIQDNEYSQQFLFLICFKLVKIYFAILIYLFHFISILFYVFELFSFLSLEIWIFSFQFQFNLLIVFFNFCNVLCLKAFFFEAINIYYFF